uniref:Transcription factor MYB98 n=1 Tax=Aegilops tauschii TaxID=37682 RepID=N1R096_AEGTA
MGVVPFYIRRIPIDPSLTQAFLPQKSQRLLHFFLLCLPHLYRKCSCCHCSDPTSGAAPMAEWSACFDWDVAASAAENHYTSSGHGGVAQYFVHNDGGAPVGVVVIPGARSRASGCISEMDPTSFPGYGSSNVPMAIAAPARGPPRARSSGQQLRQFRGSWTVEEDTLLRAKVHEFGIGKWTNIAMYLPGRSGKQCRERWTNQLDLNIEVISQDLNFLTP